MKKNIIYTLVIWLILFSLLEAGVRAYEYFTQPQIVQAEQVSDPASIFIPHPFTAYAANPDNINHNAQGYRAEKNRTYTADSNSVNIVSLGGSSTYGTRVYLHDSYPYILEEILRKSATTDKTINVINAGLGGYSTPNIISLLSGKIIHLKPDAVIFYVGFNDAWTRLMFSGFKTDYSHAQKSWVDLDFPFWRQSRFLDIIADKLGYPADKPHIHSVAWKKMSGNPKDNFRHSSSDAFKSNLMSLISIARTHGAVPILVTQATDFKNHPLPENNKIWMQAMEENTNIIKQVAEKMSVGLIDIRKLMTDRSEYFLDVLHMSGVGNRRRAEIIAEYLMKNKFVGDYINKKETASLDLIAEYMRLLRADLFVRRVLEYRINELRKLGKEISENDEKKIINAYSDISNVISTYASVYKNISRETLIKANKFFSSELGRKSIALYAKREKNQRNRLTKDEFEKIKAYQSSSGWKEIQRQRPYINRDVYIISSKVIEDILKEN